MKQWLLTTDDLEELEEMLQGYNHVFVENVLANMKSMAELKELVEKAKNKLLDFCYTTDWMKASSKITALEAVESFLSGDREPLKKLGGGEE